MWQKCKRPSRRLRDSWRGFVCKTRVYEGRVFFAMKRSPKVFRRFQPFSPIFHVHCCLKKISMFDALFTFVEITSSCWYVLAWKKNASWKRRKKCRYTKELDYRAPNSWVPNSNCNGFWPKMLCLGFDGFDGFDGFGAPRWKDRNPWKIGKSCCGRLWNFKYFWGGVCPVLSRRGGAALCGDARISCGSPWQES